MSVLCVLICYKYVFPVRVCRQVKTCWELNSHKRYTNTYKQTQTHTNSATPHTWTKGGVKLTLILTPPQTLECWCSSTGSLRDQLSCEKHVQPIYICMRHSDFANITVQNYTFKRQASTHIKLGCTMQLTWYHLLQQMQLKGIKHTQTDNVAYYSIRTTSRTLTRAVERQAQKHTNW